MTKYSFKKGLGKGMVAMAIFAIPLVLDILPSETLNLTLGGALTMLLNYLKVKEIV